MKKIIFFVENGWAFGSIHQALSKVLYDRGIMADVLDWGRTYRPEDLALIEKSYDYFVTIPSAIGWLTAAGIPLDRIIMVAHGQWDLLSCNEKFGTNIYDQVRNYAVVSTELAEKSKEFGIHRRPVITPVGIIFDNFYRPIAQRLERVGYASAFKHQNYAGDDIKRGNLAKSATNKAKLKFIQNQKYHHFGMPAFYESVDAVIMSSTEESVGLPMLEAAAAGRLTIGTPVGYYGVNGPASGGVVVPVEPAAFLPAAQESLLYYKAHPAALRHACTQIQDYAREHYDWSRHIDAWIKLLNSH